MTVKLEPKNTRGRNDYMRKYMADRRPPSQRQLAEQRAKALRQIVKLLGEPKGETGKQIRTIAEQALNPPKTPIKDTGDE